MVQNPLKTKMRRLSGLYSDIQSLSKKKKEEKTENDKNLLKMKALSYNRLLVVVNDELIGKFAYKQISENDRQIYKVVQYYPSPN